MTTDILHTTYYRRLAIVLAGILLLALSCSKDDHGPSGGTVDPNTSIGSQTYNDSLYIHIRFNMPASAATRSGLTGGTDVGEADEYAFHDGILLLFEAGATDDAAVFNSAYNIPTLSDYADEYENLKTATYTVAISREKVESLKLAQLRAFVLLNTGGQFGVNDGELYHGLSPVGAGTATYADFKDIVCTDIGDAAHGFFMSNAPMLTKGRGYDDAEVKALSEVKAVFFSAPDADAATDAETTTIIIERAAVKVTMRLGTSPLSPIFIDGNDGSGSLPLWQVQLDADHVAWTIDNYNTAYYVARHIRPAWNTIKATYAGAPYRFVYLVTTDGLHRSQWTEDINYSNYTGNHSGTTGTDSWDDSALPGIAGTTPNYEYLSGVCPAPTAIATPCTTAGTTLYVAENTVSERCLTWYNTTRVVIKVPLKGDKMPDQFYALGVRGLNYIYSFTGTDDDARTAILTNLAAWFDEEASGYPELTFISSKAGTDIFNSSVTTITIDSDQQTFTFAFDKSGFTTDEQTDMDKLLVLLNTTNYIFHEKTMYLVSYIAHFGSADTPWNREAHAPFTTKLTDTYANTYYEGGTDDTNLVGNFMGRWSIVRDHWYQLTLHSISHIGAPTIPNPTPDTPDDQVNNPLTIVPGFPINYVGETPQW